MGDGTAVAKEASDITIIDNSFASIGRACDVGAFSLSEHPAFHSFQMTVNVAACFTGAMRRLHGHPIPLTVTQMLWVNLIMDTLHCHGPRFSSSQKGSHAVSLPAIVRILLSTKNMSKRKLSVLGDSFLFYSFYLSGISNIMM